MSITPEGSGGSGEGGYAQAMDLPALMPPRPGDLHKVRAGRVAVVGGCGVTSRLMIGAPVLAALGALRAGAGLARLFVPESIAREALTLAPSATARGLACGPDGAVDPRRVDVALAEALERCDVLAVGPGLSLEAQGAACEAVLEYLFGAAEAPVVLDADALNALAARGSAGRGGLRGPLPVRAVLTPHPGELARLCGAMGLDASGAGTDDAARRRLASAVASALRCVVVLKGASTVVASPDQVYVDPARCPALATGGTGDVLTGVIAGIIAQAGPGSEAVTPRLDLFQCACVGVRAHALAGAMWVRQSGATGGLLPDDLLRFIPAAVEACRQAPAVAPGPAPMPG